MTFTLRRVVITVKTYPELSERHTETVCTAGLDEHTGRPIRLYPVPLRYLDAGQQYQLYDEIAVPVEKSVSDPRPESFKLDATRIAFVSHMGPEHHWRERRELLFRDPSWHFPNMEALLAANAASNLSLGMVKPGAIHDVELTEKPAGDHDAYEVVRAPSCENCARRPHRMKVLDWGLLELGRRSGWEKAVARLETISNLQRYDFRLYLGNFRLHPRNFGIIGLWYPKIDEQESLF